MHFPSSLTIGRGRAPRAVTLVAASLHSPGPSLLFSSQLVLCVGLVRSTLLQVYSTSGGSVEAQVDGAIPRPLQQWPRYVMCVCVAECGCVQGVCVSVRFCWWQGEWGAESRCRVCVLYCAMTTFCRRVLRYMNFTFAAGFIFVASCLCV